MQREACSFSSDVYSLGIVLWELLTKVTTARLGRQCIVVDAVQQSWMADGAAADLTWSRPLTLDLVFSLPLPADMCSRSVLCRTSRSGLWTRRALRLSGPAMRGSDPSFPRELHLQSQS